MTRSEAERAQAPSPGGEPNGTVPFAEPRIRRALGAFEDYVLVRFALLRLLGGVYAMAFLVAALQGPALIGQDGLLPIPDFLVRLKEALGASEAILRVPTLFWIGYSDAGLLVLSWAGFALSLGVVFGLTNAIVQFVLWIVYFSIAQVGQRFYGYGWESQLLETGFVAIFLCPLRTVRPFSSAPPFLTIVLFRWLIARIMLGAGLIKVRGDPCWTELTCLDFHFETQPIPNPLSPYFHALPPVFHRIGVLFNHVVELVLPLFSFGPRRARLVAGMGFVAFQLFLIASGNLSFLNWLTIVPAMACFDDRALSRLVPRLEPRARRASFPSRGLLRASKIYGFVVLVLSLPPVLNLLSSRQAMNTSFEPLRLVNTYGAFGSVGRERREVILEGTRDEALGPDTTWAPYELPCKPGDVHRSLCFISPYHLRLDWQIWFAPFGTIESQPWLVVLAYKLLSGSPAVKPLLARDPFANEPPRFVRASLYRYRMNDPFESTAVWQREYLGTYMRPVSLSDPAVQRFIESRRAAP